MIMRPGKITLLVCALTACAGPSAGGQAAPTAAVQTVRPTSTRSRRSRSPSRRRRVHRGERYRGGQRADGSGSGVVRHGDAGRVGRAGGGDQRRGDGPRPHRACRSGLPGLELETFGYSLRPEYATTPRACARSWPTRRSTTCGDRFGPRRGRWRHRRRHRCGRQPDRRISFEASDTEAARSEALAEAVRTPGMRRR